MGKRKEQNVADEIEEGSSDGDNMEEIQVNFDFFDPKEIDYLNIKNFIKQLFGSEDLIDTSKAANLIISQPLIGTTIKAESEDDALAIFTVLNLNVHKEDECIQQFISYILNSAGKDSEVGRLINQSLETINSGKDLGWLVNERLINMPVAIAPPMYTMLGEEIQWAIEDGEPYNFAYYLLISKTYVEVAPDTTGDWNSEEPSNKRNKAQPSGKLGYVHMEDEIVAQFATYTIPLKFHSEKVSDANRVFNEFGIVPGRQLFVLEAAKMVDLVQALKQAIPQP